MTQCAHRYLGTTTLEYSKVRAARKGLRSFVINLQDCLKGACEHRNSTLCAASCRGMRSSPRSPKTGQIQLHCIET